MHAVSRQSLFMRLVDRRITLRSVREAASRTADCTRLHTLHATPHTARSQRRRHAKCAGARHLCSSPLVSTRLFAAACHRSPAVAAHL